MAYVNTDEQWRTCPRCHARYVYYPNLPPEVRQDYCEVCIIVIEEVSNEL